MEDMVEWEDMGEISFDGDQLRAPELPSKPGLYRLSFASGAVYIGEASDLQRRVGDYLLYHESTGIENEYRINKRLRAEGGAHVEILRSESFNTRSVRCIREHQEVKAARERQGSNVLNGGSIQERIEFHLSEISRLVRKLSQSQASGVETSQRWQDLDEMMHSEMLDSPIGNALADEQHASRHAAWE